MSSRKGRSSPMTAAFAADTSPLPTTGPVQLGYYNETFNATDGFVNDQEITHDAANGRDMTDPGPALERAAGGLTVPMDLASLTFFLEMLCGPPSSIVEDTGVTPARQTRTFVSGTDTQRLAAFSLPVADDKFKVVQNAFLNTMGFSVSKQDGYRTMDLGMLVPGVDLLGAAPAFVGAGSPVSYTQRKVAGNIGTFSIGGVVVADLIDGNFSFSNQGELLDLADGTDQSLGQESGDTLIRSDLTMRIKRGIAQNDILDNFQGATGAFFSAEYSFPIDANASLLVTMPNCKGERRMPTIGSAQRQTFSAPIQAFQDGGTPAATFTLVNQVQP